MSDHRWALDAAPYVLGALEEEERRRFEAHLSGCAECRAAVEGIAGLPALLDSVPPRLVGALSEGLGAAPTEDEDPPPLLLADLLRRSQHERRRRRYAVGALAVAAAVALVLALPALGLSVPWAVDDAGPTAAGEAIVLDPVADTPVTASVRLDDVAWGTRIELVCRYRSSGGEPGSRYGERDGRTAYALVVRDAGGGVEEVATWSAVPGGEVTVPAATLLDRAAIVAVELRSEDGDLLLSAAP